LITEETALLHSVKKSQMHQRLDQAKKLQSIPQAPVSIKMEDKERGLPKFAPKMPPPILVA